MAKTYSLALRKVKTIKGRKLKILLKTQLLIVVAVHNPLKNMVIVDQF